MKKMFILMFLAIMTITMVTGCGGKKEKVVIFTSNEEAVDQALQEMFNKKFKNVDIVLQYYATGNNAAKIKSEGTDTEADMVIGLETAQMQGLVDNFETLDFVDTSKYVDGVNPDHKKYVIDIQYSASIIVDTKYFKEHNLEIPKTYEDLLDPKFEKLIAMPNPKTSGTGYMLYLNAINVMGQEKALQYFKDLNKNIFSYTESGSGPMSLLKQGEVAIAVGLTYQAVAENNAGADFTIVELESGSMYNSTGASIIKGHATDTVKEVFQYYVDNGVALIIKDYTPSEILKGVETNVKGYPKTKKLGDMTGIYDVNVKEKYLKLWEY